MHSKILLSAALPVLGATLLCAAPAAHAALALGYETTNPTGTANVTTGAGMPNVLDAPSTTTYGNSFSLVPPATMAALLPPPNEASTYNFYDDFLINVPISRVNTLSSSINLGDLISISNLQVRLYAGATPTLGVPAGGAIVSWSAEIDAGPATGTIAVLPETVLGAGDYVLEVRGLVSGQFGGSYSGVLNVATVPLPMPVNLFALGFSSVMLAVRRRRAVR